ncbi:MAG: hypothetical protein UR66_C0021G0004 [Candidatus Moranbacteria bacterium GW2011_GWE1_35_17]|nr:MAG: hypothetical protein UR66_C0021G0004 [Candidatus Moranbacteria bacterium GW2011_GWE1_35_17]
MDSAVYFTQGPLIFLSLLSLKKLLTNADNLLFYNTILERS